MTLDNSLRECNTVYEQIVAHIVNQHHRGADSGTLITWIQIVSTFAWFHHCGRFSDHRLENILLELGADLEEKWGSPSVNNFLLPEESRRTVLHVATAAFGTGGHTRLISNWIRLDPGSCHHVVLLRQEDEPVPSWLADTIRDNGGRLIIFPPHINAMSAAHDLRTIAQSNVNMVVLHIHPHDVVPVLAFATPRCPPIALLNHADHVFGLGVSIADLFIDFREEGRELSEQRRMARQTILLPVPLHSKAVELTREQARQQLNIPPDQIMLLSIGSEYKFRPNQSHNFYRTCVRLLDENVNAHLYLIGVTSSEASSYLPDAKHDRFHALGVIEKPTAYYRAADVYLGGFPCSSWTALLEAALHGNAPVGMFSPVAPILNDIDIALTGITENSLTELEYIDKVSGLIRMKEEREALAARAQAAVMDYHSGPKWLESLEAVYRHLETAKHSPNPISHSAYLETDNDMAVSRLSVLSKTSSPLILELAEQYFGVLTLRDLAALFAMFIRAKTCKLSWQQLNRWRRLFLSAWKRSIQSLKNRLIGFFWSRVVTRMARG